MIYGKIVKEIPIIISCDFKKEIDAIILCGKTRYLVYFKGKIN